VYTANASLYTRLATESETPTSALEITSVVVATLAILIFCSHLLYTWHQCFDGFLHKLIWHIFAQYVKSAAFTELAKFAHL
jgi:hypothetical protein